MAMINSQAQKQCLKGPKTARLALCLQPQCFSQNEVLLDLPSVENEKKRAVKLKMQLIFKTSHM